MKNIKIKRLVALTYLALVIALPLFSIDFIPGAGEQVFHEIIQSRERPFFYHNNTDDQHWYGTDKWAVRFDFSEVYPTYNTSSFLINKVQVYFPVIPVTAVPVTVEIYSDAGNVPASLLSSVSANLSTNWMEFTLSQPQTLEVAWVVVNCATIAGGPYMSASIGDGSHSYYWNTNSPTYYYQNMLTAGYSSEFLISVIGRFELSGLDLELFAFDLKPEISLSSIVYPEFTIYNNSNSTVLNPIIELDITSPNPAYTVQDTIFVNSVLLPHSELTVLYNDPDMLSYAYTLPDFPGQIKIKAVLRSEVDQADTLYNNSVTNYKSIFNNNLPVELVENFVQYNTSGSILQAQDNLLNPENKVINYFPLVADAYYTSGAVQRYNWYGLTGYPMTVVGGDDKLAGFIPSAYSAVFSAALDQLNLDRTFLQETNSILNLASPYVNLQVKLSLRNSQSYLFNSVLDPSLVLQSRFFAALCKRVSFYNSERLVFNRWGAYADTIATALTFGQSWTKQFNLSISDISLDSLMANYELVYWIQHNTNKQIIYANAVPLSSIVSNEDELAPGVAFRLILSPNPVKLGTDLNLNLTAPAKANIINYGIYNLKGQLIQRGEPQFKNREFFIHTQQIKTAGVYIIRFDLDTAQKSHQTITKKIVVY